MKESINISVSLLLLALSVLVLIRLLNVAVHELNKPDEFSLGTMFKPDPAHKYSDLDELIEAHVRKMARKVNELTSNDKWKGTKEALGEFS